MKIATYEHRGQKSFGVVLGGVIVDLGSRIGNKYPGVLELLRAEALDEAGHAIEGASADVDLRDVTLLRPVPFPEKIFCVGVNYANRNAEYKDGSDAPKYPSIFVRTPDSLVGHNTDIVRPPESEQFDYEGEIVIIIGKSGRRIKKENVRGHIAGLSIMNEGTIRDWLRHAKFNVTQGKNFASTGAFGPWIVTTEEFPGFGNLKLETRVNGEVRQSDTTKNLVFNFEYLLSYLSTFMELKPGDVIATGTPTGAGTFFDPPKWLVPGDVVEVEVEGIGTLRNTVVDEIIK